MTNNEYEILAYLEKSIDNLETLIETTESDESKKIFEVQLELAKSTLETTQSIVGQDEMQVIKADSQAAKFCGNCTYLSVTEDEQNSHPEKKDDIHWCKLFAKRVLHFDKHPNLPRLAECELIGRR